MTLPLSFNPRVSSDTKGIGAFYEQESGLALASELPAETIACLDQIWENPKRHHFYAAELRRADLKPFPYHFLYRITATSVRIFVIRHNHRDPNFGTSRH